MVYIEDYLQHYVEVLGVVDSNKQILESINRQCKKGTALTDRQYELVKVKLLEQFDSERFSFTGNEPTRMPLREIDRNKYITIVDNKVKVRFPFSKKTIIDLETVANSHRKIYQHQKGSHEHFFKLAPNLVFDLLNVFKKKDFEIDKELFEIYKEVNDIKENPSRYVPGLWEGKFLNFKNDVSVLIKDLKSYQILDRKKQLGLEYITGDVPSGLTGEICNRSEPYIVVNPDLYSLDKLVSSIIDLDRFPLLVVLDVGSELDQITQFYNSIKYLVPDSQQCALTRVDGSSEYNFNDFVKDKCLNNWLDNTTKIVYISKNKLPKLLIKESWRPQCTLKLTSFRSCNTVSTYINDTCDLIIAHDKEKSLFGRYATKYGLL
jgi:hypothetical protein